jgi:hypothetical protein
MHGQEGGLSLGWAKKALKRRQSVEAAVVYPSIKSQAAPAVVQRFARLHEQRLLVRSLDRVAA